MQGAHHINKKLKNSKKMQLSKASDGSKRLAGHWKHQLEIQKASLGFGSKLACRRDARMLQISHSNHIEPH